MVSRQLSSIFAKTGDTESKGIQIMALLQWQLTIGEYIVKPGSIIEITRRWQKGGQVFITASQNDSNVSATFLVRSNVSIGGKNYLLMEGTSGAREDLVVARLMDQNRLCAMDRDRYSSLSNALATFLQSDTVTPLSEFEQILGRLEPIN